MHEKARPLLLLSSHVLESVGVHHVHSPKGVRASPSTRKEQSAHQGAVGSLQLVFGARQLRSRVSTASDVKVQSHDHS